MNTHQSIPRPQIRLVLAAVFIIYLGQMTLNPIIAPLSREVGLTELQVGTTISIAAVMVVTTSRFWGRTSQSRGRKPVLVAAFALATTTMALFALLSWAGMRGLVAGTTLFAGFALLRGVGFGAAMAAVPPTAQAYIADTTHDEETRVKGMAGVGAAQGIAMVTGSVLGGVTSGFGLMAPLTIIPVLLAIGLLLLGGRLRREPHTTLIENPQQIRARDPRVWPFLLACFGTFTALSFIQVLSGFIVQDRLGLDAETTGLLTGGVLLAAGLGMIVAQTLIVPRSGWSPAALLQRGSALTLTGFAILIPELGVAGIVAANTLIGLGIGIAMPGFTAGPSLLVDRDEQGGLAGLIAATMGLTFVLGPTASTALYGAWSQLPILAGAAIMALVTAFVMLHPRFRSLPETPAQQPDET